MSLAAFRERVRELYRCTNPYGGRRPSQRDLAAAIGLHPSELSSRLNGSARAKLTCRDVRAIVQTLADWRAIGSRAVVEELLRLADCPGFTPAEWQAPPLNQLQANAVPPPRRAIGNIPHQLSSFIGRQRELAELSTMLQQQRLITLVGAGGVGKTRLALALAGQEAAQFTSGVWLVELADVRDAGAMVGAVAQVLDVREQAGQALAETLAAHLHDKRLLLVMDNCEHLISAVADLVTMLLQRCPPLSVLATSREPLHLESEALWLVPPLSLPNAKVVFDALGAYEAVQLFVERAAAYPRFRLNRNNAAAVLEICQHLDGIPLAIELAAARLQVLSARQIADRLGERFRLLTSSRPLPPRQQTLRALLDWSYDLLTLTEQWLFRRLAVFAAGFTVAAVTEIAACNLQLAALSASEAAGGDDSEASCDRVFAALVDKSLVRAVESGDAVRRFTMLETVREYARLQLERCGEQAAWREHAAYYQQLAEAAEPELRGPSQALWLARLEAEHDNIRAALANLREHGEQEAALRLASAIWQFWYIRGYLSEGRRWLTAALTPAAPRALQAKVVGALGKLTYEAGDAANARAHFDIALAAYRAEADELGVATTLSNLAGLATDDGNYALAEQLLQEGLTLRRRLGDNWAVAVSLHNLAVLLSQMGRWQDSATYEQEAWQLRCALDDRRGMATSLAMLGHISMRFGDYAAARDYCEQSLRIAAELSDRRTTSVAQHILGIVRQRQGDYAAAAQLYHQSLAIHLEMDDQRGVAEYLEEVATLELEQGQPAAAVNALAMAASLREHLGVPLPQFDHDNHAQLLAALRQQVGAAELAQRWAAASMMSAAQIVAAVAANAIPPLPVASPT